METTESSEFCDVFKGKADTTSGKSIVEEIPVLMGNEVVFWRNPFRYGREKISHFCLLRTPLYSF